MTNTQFKTAFRGVLAGQMYYDKDFGVWYKFNGTGWDEVPAPSPEELQELEQNGMILE